MSIRQSPEGYWIIDFTVNGRRIRQSSQTKDKALAQQLHDKLKAEAWQIKHFDIKPRHTWQEAVTRWIKESQHLKSLKSNLSRIRGLHKYLHNKHLNEITKQLINDIIDDKLEEGLSNSTINRYLALISVILNKAVKHWDWLDSVPVINLLPEDNARIRWITKSEALRLLNELPEHLRDAAEFTLETGLRASNITGLEWQWINVGYRHAFIPKKYMKNGRALALPLNDKAIEILKRQVGKHPVYVFTYNGQRIKYKLSTPAWKKALKRAGIEDFRWHDLRHTWASWHVMNGTSIRELMDLGGWSSYSIVLRYAHLSSAHLLEAANRLKEAI
jgi:integrase